MTGESRYLTVVFRDTSREESAQLLNHERMSAASWSHAIHDRDSLCAPGQPLTDQQIDMIDSSTHFHESPDWARRFARAIELAHGIGSNATERTD